MNEKTYIGSPDNPRTTAVVAYITFIGWIIAYFFLYPNNRISLSTFHLRQSLLIHIISFLIRVAFSFYFFSVTIWNIVWGVCTLGLFIIWLMGFWDALSGRERHVPVLGRIAQNIFRKLK